MRDYLFILLCFVSAILAVVIFGHKKESLYTEIPYSFTDANKEEHKLVYRGDTHYSAIFIGNSLFTTRNYLTFGRRQLGLNSRVKVMCDGRDRATCEAWWPPERDGQCYSKFSYENKDITFMAEQ